MGLEGDKMVTDTGSLGYEMQSKRLRLSHELLNKDGTQRPLEQIRSQARRWERDEKN